ncbi:MAG: MGMT family protein [Candidatus Nanopelagicales bacterium]
MKPPTSLDEVILEVVGAIPRGALAAYGDVCEVVRELGFACTPRRVARTMSAYGGQPGVAWWRVVQATGTLAEPVAAAAASHLLAEGVEVRGRLVPLADRRWSPTPADVASIAARLDPGGPGDQVRR